MSKKRGWIKGIVIMSMFFALCASGTLEAAFEDLGAGARILGMGGAFTGLSNDVLALYYNPAGLAQLKGMEFSSMYAKLFWGLTDASDLNDFFLGGGYNFGKNLGAVGIGWLGRNLTSFYSENTIYISYGRQIVPSLSLGANLKMHSLQYYLDSTTQGDPVFDLGNSRSGFGADAGVLLDLGKISRPLDKFFLGLLLQNLTQPDLGLKVPNNLPLIIRIGTSYCPGSLKILTGTSKKGKSYFEINDMVVNADIVLHEGKYRLLSGVEMWLYNNSLGLRGGFGIGSCSYMNFSTGASYRFMQLDPYIQIDYAFLYALSGASAGTLGDHRISFNLHFLSKEEKEKKKLVEMKKELEEKKIEEEKPLAEEKRKLEELRKKLEEKKPAEEKVEEKKKEVIEKEEAQKKLEELKKKLEELKEKKAE